MKKIQLLTLALIMFIGESVFAQNINMPAPSTKQTITQEFGLSTVEIEYSRPNMKGRTIFGDLVPYDKMWRTGANMATKFTFGDDVTIGGKKIEKGSYALFTIPGKKEWTIIINKGFNNGGLNNYKESDDVHRFTVVPTDLPFTMETFLIATGDVTDTSMNVSILWEDQDVTFAIETEIEDNIMSQIDKQMNNDNRPYFAAASYYFNNGKDNNKALEWATKAFDANPNAFWIANLKAKIQAKTGDKLGAIATAKQSIELATKAKNMDYVKLNEKLIDSLK